MITIRFSWNFPTFLDSSKVKQNSKNNILFSDQTFDKMEINYLGIFSIIVFYLLILGVGMWAASKKAGDEMDQEVRSNFS